MRACTSFMLSSMSVTGGLTLATKEVQQLELIIYKLFELNNL